MGGMEWLLEIVLVMLLGATLFQAIRLERALGVMKRDKASFKSLVAGFNASTYQAESGIQQLRSAADGAGRNIESQLSKSTSLKDDLTFLTERGDRLADRLEALVRSAKSMTQERPPEPAPQKAGSLKQGSRKNTGHDEQDVLNALRMAR